MGGRSSASGLTVTVFGATGHIGRHVVNRLGRMGSTIVVPFRGDEYDIQSLRVMGDLGQINPIRFHLKDHNSIVDCIKHSNVVINLIAQDRRTLNFGMREVNVDGAASIAKACRQLNIPRFIHVSSLRADPKALSEFSRTKFEGECRVREANPDAVLVRPATIFGTNDHLINGIGQFTRFWSGYPMVGDGSQVRRPLHITDAADALTLLSKSEKNISGSEWALLGPRAYTYRRLIELFAYATMSPLRLTSLSPRAFWLYCKIFPVIGTAPFPYDTILQLGESERDRRIGGYELGMEDLGFGRDGLVKVEDRMLEIARGYRRVDDFGLPLSFPPELLQEERLI